MPYENKLLAQLLQHIGDTPAARHYLRKYANRDKLAVIKIGGGVIAAELPALAQSLLLLSRLGLKIVIIHGAGPQIDQALQQRNLETQRLDGMRVTPEPHIQAISAAIEATHQQLLRGLRQQRIQCASLWSGVFQCRHLDQARYGEVGAIEQVDTAPILRQLKQQQVVIVPCLGHLDETHPVNINADCATRELSWALQPDKVIFVTPTGGLLDAQGKRISAIHLHSQYDNLMQQDWIHSGMRLKLEQIHALLQPLPESMRVSITSAHRLVQELFTHQGAGTYIAKGEQIEHYKNLSDAHVQQLTGLLETSFGRQLKPAAIHTRPVRALFLAASAEAAALVVEGHNGVPYLDKFAVTPKARGRGLAAALWQQLNQHFPELYWRSRADNQINSWYFRQAEISYRINPWVGFAYGMDMERALPCLQHAMNLQESWL